LKCSSTGQKGRGMWLEGPEGVAASVRKPDMVLRWGTVRVWKTLYHLVFRGCSSARQSASLARKKPGVQIPSPPPRQTPLAGVFLRFRHLDDRALDALWTRIGRDLLRAFPQLPRRRPHIGGRRCRARCGPNCVQVGRLSGDGFTNAHAPQRFDRVGGCLLNSRGGGPSRWSRVEH